MDFGNFGMIIIQAFQKIPGVNELFFSDPALLNKWAIVAGVITIMLYIVGVGLILAGIVNFAIKKIQSEKNGQQRTPTSFLIGGIVGGLILILLPSIILVIGEVMGNIASIN